LAFLEHHFELQANGETQDIPITNAPRALAYAIALNRHTSRASVDLSRTRNRSGFGKPSWSTFRWSESRWFDPGVEIPDEDGRREFCPDWASSVDGIERTKDVKRAVASVLLGIANSAMWRPHIPQDKWKLLEDFNELPDESSSRLGCEANEEFVSALKAMDNRGVLKLWLAILWRAYADLKPVVAEQLAENTREVIEAGSHDVGLFMAVTESEKTAVGDEMLVYSR
jgi:hypothetical protein